MEEWYKGGSFLFFFFFFFFLEEHLYRKFRAMAYLLFKIKFIENFPYFLASFFILKWKVK